MDSTAADRFDTSRFEASRNRLASLAYRLLGSATDAEDAVQDAFLHWQAADRRRIKELVQLGHQSGDTLAHLHK